MWKIVSPLNCGWQGWEGTLRGGIVDVEGAANIPDLSESKRLAIKCRLFTALSRWSDLLLVLLTDALSWKWMFIQSSRLTALQPSIYPFLRIIWQQIWHDLTTVERLDVWREERGLKQLCNREGRQEINLNVPSADPKCDVNVAMWT